MHLVLGLVHARPVAACCQPATFRFAVPELKFMACNSGDTAFQEKGKNPYPKSCSAAGRLTITVHSSHCVRRTQFNPSLCCICSTAARSQKWLLELLKGTLVLSCSIPWLLCIGVIVHQPRRLSPAHVKATIW